VKARPADTPRPHEAPPSVRAIHDEIRRDIVTLRLKPNARLSENELALRFRTSRTPVREALIRLVDDGLIEVWPQRGSFVSRISLAAVRRARFVREALEVAVVRRAAEAGLPHSALEALDAAIAEQEAAEGDPELFTLADDAFHRGLADNIGFGGLWSVIEDEKAQLDRIRFLSLPNVTPIEALIAQHRAILRAVGARDPAAAERDMREHMAEVLKVADALAAEHADLIARDI
jgi:DNA-binding GntR family transcriptional regulator